MNAFQIAGVGIIGAFLAITLKNWRPEIAMVIGVAAGVILLIGIMGTVENVIDEYGTLLDRSGIDKRYFKLLIKIIGVSYITKFATEICNDSGESAIAGRVELAGKVTVFAMTIPIINSFLSLIIDILDTF